MKSTAYFPYSLIALFSELQVAQLKELSKQPDIYERLTKSLAPNIWELDDVKKGLLCQVTSFSYLPFCIDSLFCGYTFTLFLLSICCNWADS